MIPKVTVLICAYNEEKTIERTIESALDQILKPYEVIIVNDGSTDNTRKILERYRRNPSIIVIDLPRNSGCKARAQKAAIGYISGDLVALIDADTEVSREFLLMLVPHFVDKRVGGVTAKIMSRRRNWLTAVRQIEYIIAFGPTGRLGMNALNVVLILSGSCCIVRKELFEPSDDTVTEDFDLTLSILEKGYKVAYEPRGIAITEDPPTLRLYINQISRWYSGALQNFKKHWRRMPLRIKLLTSLIFLEFTILPLIMLSLLILTLINPLYLYGLLAMLFFDLIPSVIAGIYGAFKLNRRDLLPAILPAIAIKFLNYLVWTKCVFSTYILKKEPVWLRSKQ